MKFSAQLFLALAIMLGFGTLSTAAVAQTTADPLEDFQTRDNSSNPFEGSGNSAQGGVFDIIHNTVFSNQRSVGDFNEARSENIQNQADSFKERQRLRLEGETQTNSTITGSETPE